MPPKRSQPTEAKERDETDPFDSKVGECLSSLNNDLNDAVTARERLRNRRKAEVRALYESSLPRREENDQARAVVCNVHHQQMDVAPSEMGHPLVDNLVKGAYYNQPADTPVTDIAKPRGLGRRSGSPGSSPTRSHAGSSVVGGTQRPGSAAQRPGSRTTTRPLPATEAREEALAVVESAKHAHDVPVPKKPYEVRVGPYPQDDAHDYWYRKLPPPTPGKPQIAVSKSGVAKSIGVQAGDADVRPGPHPNFDTHSAQAIEADKPDPNWQKPCVTELKPDTDHGPGPRHVTRQTETDAASVASSQATGSLVSGVALTGPRSHIPPLAQPAVPRPMTGSSTSSSQRFAARPRDTAPYLL